MTVTKFIKTPKLFEYLDLEVSEALHRHGIRDMFDYAGVGEDTPSEEFVGWPCGVANVLRQFCMGAKHPSI